MLIQPDIHELGDKRLDPKEALAKIKEGNIALRQSMGHTIPHQELLKRREIAEGHKMDWRELIRRLNLLCPLSLVIFDSIVQGAPTIAIKTPVNGDNGMELQYVTGFPKTVLPEYSWIEVDEHNCPTNEHRGWRNVVRTLWQRGLTDGPSVARIFGDALGARSELHSKTTPKN